MKVLYAGPDDDLVMRNSGGDRKDGLHLSDITKRMIFEKDRKLNPNSPIDAMVLERGFTWESVLESALAARHERVGYRPEQLQEDGIWMSPDWLNEDADIQHEEWKATKKSLRQVREQGFGTISWTWFYNVKAYVRKLAKDGAIKRLASRIRVWFINGDYSYESKSSDFHLLNDYWRFDLEFEKRELEENWREILSAARRYGLLKEAPTEQWPTKKNASSQPRKSPAKVLRGTFPSTKTSSKRRAES